MEQIPNTVGTDTKYCRNRYQILSEQIPNTVGTDTKLLSEQIPKSLPTPVFTGLYRIPNPIFNPLYNHRARGVFLNMCF
jgi:hypothetical protein